VSHVSPVLLGATSAFLFGAMTVALRIALHRGGNAETGAFLTVLVAFAVVLPFALAAGGALDGIWPFLLAGILAPGGSQVLFTLAVRDAGPSRASVVVGTAPLFAVAIALVFLDEPLEAGLVVGALLIVSGGVALASERRRPDRFTRIGLVFALGATVLFATRDNLVRRLAGDTDVEASMAAAATLAAGAVCILVFLLSTGRRARFLDVPLFAPAGLCFGLSYVTLFAAFYGGRVSIVSPLVATESLWGVVLSALVLGRSERIGARLVVGAALIVAGGVLIAVFR
jgi:drug/metabolite transporter (DMT)-like permease